MLRVLVALTMSALSAACTGAESTVQLRGLYYWGHEVETLHPCNSEQAFWVVGDDAVLKPLRDTADDLSQAKGEPYQPVYVEVSAVPEGEAKDGFAADYDGVYRLTAVHTTQAPGLAGCAGHG